MDSSIEVIEIKDEVIESVDVPIQNGTSSAIDIKGPSKAFLNNSNHQIYLSFFYQYFLWLHFFLPIKLNSTKKVLLNLIGKKL